MKKYESKKHRGFFAICDEADYNKELGTITLHFASGNRTIVSKKRLMEDWELVNADFNPDVSADKIIAE